MVAVRWLSPLSCSSCSGDGAPPAGCPLSLAPLAQVMVAVLQLVVPSLLLLLLR
ncbi:hypothetical protein DPMN_157422 [Dreissena polymorpha]|uniref:Uncharacterized protein n=1 Tax=Dreissena polymorpha TaxID=45954 RepID=A0A9D4EH74_DREPO|nr:hypothetical protein DPMN_157422 [Dreissena polymorpha]